ncbi:MAG: hypothetical protein AB1779_11555, partial [Candidatus Thermoplasmatota archaeon]
MKKIVVFLSFLIMIGSAPEVFESAKEKNTGKGNYTYLNPISPYAEISNIDIIYPRLATPVIKQREQKFTALVKASGVNEKSDWDAKLFTWYSEFRLNVTSIAYEEPYWKLDLEIPKYVFEDL